MVWLMLLKPPSDLFQDWAVSFCRLLKDLFLAHFVFDAFDTPVLLRLSLEGLNLLLKLGNSLETRVFKMPVPGYRKTLLVSEFKVLFFHSNLKHVLNITYDRLTLCKLGYYKVCERCEICKELWLYVQQLWNAVPFMINDISQRPFGPLYS